jgi:Ni/Fe-hydrogenase 1 B-type cytochrome subunit
MRHEVVRRVRVWSSVVRTLHWAMALATLALAASGWLLARVPGEFPDLAEVHRNLGYLLVAALATRVYLLFFGRGPEHWRDFVPWPPQHRAAWQVLRFYLSLARAPLPAYFAHNPLWGPLYLLLYALLAVQGATGLAGLTGAHRLGFALVVGFSVAHVLASFLHDWKGGGADVSALINGYRVYLPREAGVPGPAPVHEVPLESLRRPPRPGRPAP